MRATCTAHLIPLDLITLTILGTDQNRLLIIPLPTVPIAAMGLIQVSIHRGKDGRSMNLMISGGRLCASLLEK